MITSIYFHIQFFFGLNMSLVPALSSDFDISPYTFFCLELIPALCKNIGIGSSVNFLLKKKHKTIGIRPCTL